MNNDEDCGLLMKRVSDSIYRFANNNLLKQGVTLAQVRILELLETQQGMASLQQIGNFLGVSKPTVTGLVQRLVAKGYIDVAKDPVKARVKNVHINDEGRAAFQRINDNSFVIEDAMLQNFSEEEANQFRSFLKRVEVNVTKDKWMQAE